MALEDRLHASLGRYMRAPEWVRKLGGSAYRALPARVKFGPRHAAFLDDARASAHTSWDEVAQRLDATLQAASQVPAHAEHAASMRDSSRPVLERLRALPLVSKADIKADLEARLHPGFGAQDRLRTFTGGSTAEPMLFYLHRHVTRPKESAYIEHVERHLLSAVPGEWTLSLRGRTVASAAGAGGRLWTPEPIKRHLLFSSDHLEPRYMPDYMSALSRWRPRRVHAFPSALYPLARWLRDHPDQAVSDAVEGILLTSENVYDFQLALFEAVFPRARIVQHYGHSERVLMSVAQGRHGQAEFLPRYGYPELVDARGRVIETPGVLGEIVGTSFDNHAMPFVRYRTGDMGCWAVAPKHEGIVRHAMERIEGRSQEFVVCADRRLVSITTLGAAHFDELAFVQRIQFEQHAPGRLTLKAVCPGGLRDDERLRVARAVRQKTQGGCEVDVQVVADIATTARGKQRMLVQHLDLADYLGAAVTPEREERLLAEARLALPAAA